MELELCGFLSVLMELVSLLRRLANAVGVRGCEYMHKTYCILGRRWVSIYCQLVSVHVLL